MRTNIVLDDKLVKKAFKHTSVKTKKGLITQALKEFVENHSRKNFKKLRGKIKFQVDYNYKKMRQGRI